VLLLVCFFLFALAPSFLQAAIASCPKCGGAGKVPIISDCTNSFCRKGIEIKYVKQYDTTKKRNVTNILTSPCRCCGGSFEMAAYGTNSTHKIQLPRGKIFAGFNPCERCGNIVFVRTQERSSAQVQGGTDSGEAGRETVPPVQAIKDQPPKDYPSKCKSCSGKGYVYNTCTKCDGKGYIRVLTDRDMSSNYDHRGRHKTRLSNCPQCGGGGRRGQIKVTCQSCGGRGTL
jgi:RecJ-like exonuclease